VCAFDIDRAGDGRLPEGPVTLGVRPHDLEIVSAGEADGSGLVELVEPASPVSVLHLRVSQLPDQLLRVTAAADALPDRGGTVPFRVRRDRCHVFNRQSGEVLLHGEDLGG
jgi:hypothetical protein